MPTKPAPRWTRWWSGRGVTNNGTPKARRGAMLRRCLPHLRTRPLNRPALRLLFALLLTPWLACADVRAAGAVRVVGSTTFLSFVQHVAEDYMAQHPKATVVVNAGGSSRGYKAVLDGTADVAVVSGRLPEELQREFSRRKIVLNQKTVGYRALVAAVHPSNPVRNLSHAELSAVFSGQISSWKTLGVPQGKPIQLLIGPPGGGLTDIWKSEALIDGATFSAKAQVRSAAQRAAMVAKNPDAITYLAMNDDTPGLAYLSINGVPPTARQVADGAYLLRSQLTLISRGGSGHDVEDFLRHFEEPQPYWVLDGLMFAKPR